MGVTLEQLQQVVADKFGGVLTAGAHSTQTGACVWEAYNFARGKDWGDRCPDCVAPDIHRLLMRLNDSPRWASDAERTEMLLPAVIRALGTREGGDAAREKRAFRLADVAVRKFAAAALDCAKQPELAKRLRELPEITSRALAATSRDVTREVRAAAAADAYAAADAAAYAAAAAAAAADAYAAAAAAAYAYAAAYAAADAAADADAARRPWREYVHDLLRAAGLAGEES